MKVTIRTVAEQAQVSLATVSRVINEPERVNSETRQRVLEVMQRLDYRPNELAKALSSKSTKTIGVVIPGITNFYFNELYKGIDRAALEYGMHVLLYDSERNPNSVSEAIYFLKQRNVDGVIFSSAFFSEEYTSLISRLNIPVVLVLTESVQPDFAAFKVDDVKASFDAVQYLIMRGHKRIAMIAETLNEKIGGCQRYEGYRMALDTYQLPFDDSIIAFGDCRFDSGYQAMQKLLDKFEDNSFTAVFAASDEMAIGAMSCIHDKGLRIPEDISIIGYDNLPISRMVYPRLTTVEQPFERIGSESVMHLMNLINGDYRVQNQGIHYLPHRIIGRQTVANAILNN